MQYHAMFTDSEEYLGTERLRYLKAYCTLRLRHVPAGNGRLCSAGGSCKPRMHCPLQCRRRRLSCSSMHALRIQQIQVLNAASPLHAKSVKRHIITRSAAKWITIPYPPIPSLSHLVTAAASRLRLEFRCRCRWPSWSWSPSSSPRRWRGHAHHDDDDHDHPEHDDALGRAWLAPAAQAPMPYAAQTPT